MSDDLVAFLRARLDDDEQIARAPLAATWAKPDWEFMEDDEDGPAVDLGTNHLDRVSSLNGSEMEHIARHDPARILAEVAAKRQVIDQYESIGNPPPGEIGPDLVRAELGRVLRLLALPYVGHPDYREEWKP